MSRIEEHWNNELTSSATCFMFHLGPVKYASEILADKHAVTQHLHDSQGSRDGNCESSSVHFIIFLSLVGSNHIMSGISHFCQ